MPECTRAGEGRLGSPSVTEQLPGDPSISAYNLLSNAPRTFFDVPSVRDLGALETQVAFLGVPFDAGTPQPGNRTGQTAGPAAARLASSEQFEYGPRPDGGAEGWYDIESDREYLVGITMADVGDVAIQGSDDVRNFARITEVARRVTEGGCLLVAVGGDHSISFPLGRGVLAPDGIDVVHIDAHADFVDELDGSRFTGASQLRRLAELASVRSVTALGLRNVDGAEVEGMRELGARWATTLDLIDHGAAAVVPNLLADGGALYVSIDLDVLDLGLVPGTTLPEPGGLSYRQLRSVLCEVAGRGRVVGFDIAELNPPYDPSGGTARLATWLVTHFLSEIFDHPR
jgi:agmatinase